MKSLYIKGRHSKQYGGNWNDGASCGSRTVNCNTNLWNVNTNVGCRLACESCIDTLDLLFQGIIDINYRESGVASCPFWAKLKSWLSSSKGIERAATI